MSRERGEHGFRRTFGTVLLVVFAAVVTLAVRRVTSLSGLPDIGDPFDIEERYAYEIPPIENAWVYYIQAGGRLTGEPEVAASASSPGMPDPALLAWVDRNRESLNLLVEGATKSKAMYTPLKSLDFGTLLPGVQQLRSLGRLALYEAARLENAGDVAGAWDLYRTVLRASRHCGMNGTLIERLVGCALHSMAASRILAWSKLPKVDAALLRRALAETIEAEAMTPKPSETLKSEYLGMMKSFRDAPDQILGANVLPSGGSPNWKSKVAAPFLRVLSREPERSRRTARLVFANWLAAADLPTAERDRRRLDLGIVTLYRVPEDADPRLHPLTPEALRPWIESSVFVRLSIPAYDAVDRALRRDESSRAALIVHLAERLARAETGREPDSVNALVGTYLKEIPAGYVFEVGPPADLAPKPPKNAR